jgi:ABC-type branched-subunit amino acid transport system ATPase component
MGRAMTQLAIATEQLTRRFGALTAVDSVDLRVQAGQFFGFLGPNGAGKSTTIKMLTGLLAPTSGRMELLGVDFQANPVEVKRQIGVVPEGMGLFERLTGPEYLRFVGRMYGLDRATTEQRSQELLEFKQLADREKTLVADESASSPSRRGLCQGTSLHDSQRLRIPATALAPHHGRFLHLPVRSRLASPAAFTEAQHVFPRHHGLSHPDSLVARV